MDVTNTEGSPIKAIVKTEYGDLTPKTKAERTLTIADNFLTTVEGRIAKSGVGEIAADVARYEAASSVVHMFTRVRFDLIGRIITAVGPLDLSGVQTVERDDFFKRLGDKIGVLQFSSNFTPEAQPAEKIYQAREMLRNYSFNLACSVAQRLLPQYPELAEYVEKRNAPNMYEVVKKYRKKHKNAPEYLDGMVAICLNIRQMQDYGNTYPLYDRFISNINTSRFQFMDQVADKALTEREQQRLGQVLAYGHDLEFGRGTFFDQMVSNVISKDE